ncbi:MAG: methyltransferase [Pseudomonadota bacterium]
MTETIEILGKRLTLAHLRNGFKTSMDSVLLAAACPVQANEKVLDMGCGIGGAGFCVLARVSGVSLTGVDIQEAQIELAAQNADKNQFENTAFVTSDIIDFKREKEFHHIIMNPPYLDGGKHLRSPHPEKATAMGHEENAHSIKEWIDIAHFNLKSKGTLTIIHRADQIDEIIRIMGKRFGAIEIIPLWPKVGVNAKRVIIRAIKDRRSPSVLHSGVVLHDLDGQYTIEADEILKNAKGLLL